MEKKKNGVILQNGSNEMTGGPPMITKAPEPEKKKDKKKKNAAAEKKDDDDGGPQGGHVVRMRGLPFSVTKNDIAEWFSSVVDVDPVNIDIQKNTGYADVHFEIGVDAKKAMTKDGRKMKHRYIELFYDNAKK